MTTQDAAAIAEPGDTQGVAFALLTDPALSRTVTLRRTAAALCLLVGLGCVASMVWSSRFVPLGAAALVAGAWLHIGSTTWSTQRLRTWHVAQQAVPDAATVIREWTSAGGVRHLTLRADGAEPASDFTWRLPASWGDPVRLDRTGRRVAVLSRAGRADLCAPVLRGGLPFVLPDYLLSALIAVVAEDIPPELRHPRLAELTPAAPGTIPPPSALPVTLAPAADATAVWAVGVSATVASAIAGVWLVSDPEFVRFAVIAFVAAGLLAIGTAVAHSSAMRVTIGADGIDAAGPLTTRRPSSRVPWSQVEEVELRWMSRAKREARDSGETAGQLLGAAGLASMGFFRVRFVRPDRSDAEVVGDLVARLVRGDIIPEVDTVRLVLRSRSGRRIATVTTRTAFQAVRALLLACAEHRVRVTVAEGASPGFA